MDLTKDLIAATESVRKKYEEMRRGKFDLNTDLEEVFKPVTKPLKEVLEKSSSQNEKSQQQQKQLQQQQQLLQQTYQQQQQHQQLLQQTQDQQHKHARQLETLQHKSSIQPSPARSSIPPLRAQKDSPVLHQNYYTPFLEKVMYEPENTDQIYGLRYDNYSNQFHIGNKPVQIENGDLIIDGKKFQGTLGLYQWLVRKHPPDTDSTDKEVFKRIVQETSAHKENYSPTGNIAVNKSWKFKNVIEKDLVSGSGFYKTYKPNVDYRYYDDPNELCTRLRKLYASQAAGSSAHFNEINEILEELREGGYIE